jgi:hypothetical protein
MININSLRRISRIPTGTEKREEVIKEGDKDILVTTYFLYNKDNEEVILRTERIDISKELADIQIKKDELNKKEQELLLLISE